MAAVKHRKLSPNETDPCFNGAGCDYLPTLPPQPPPIPPPKSGKHGPSVSTDITIAAAILASLILLVSYYVIVVRNCFGWIRRGNAAHGPAVGETLELIDENRGPVIDHPIWYIRTIGLQPSVINTITIFNYKRGDNLIEGTECSVCLNEFREDETLRLLPKCNHAFHIRCIDTWLRSHTNCPLCRAAIVSTAATPFRSPNPVIGNEFTQAENREGNDIEAVNHENRERIEEEEEEVEIEESDGDEARKMERLCNWSRTRRSMSVDSSPIAANAIDLDPEASQSNNARNSSIMQRVQRSFSYGGAGGNELNQ